MIILSLVYMTIPSVIRIEDSSKRENLVED